MKRRFGFVSNSSSSSFVIAKVYLTEKQINAIKLWHKDCLIAEPEEQFGDHGDVWNEDKNYIVGENYYVQESFEQMIDKNKIDRTKIIYLES